MTIDSNFEHHSESSKVPKTSEKSNILQLRRQLQICVYYSWKLQKKLVVLDQIFEQKNHEKHKIREIKI